MAKAIGDIEVLPRERSEKVMGDWMRPFLHVTPHVRNETASLRTR
jgi:hypothetical protein